MIGTSHYEISLCYLASLPIPIIIDLHLPSFTGVTMASTLLPSIEIIVYKKREHDLKKSIDKSNTLGLC